MITADNTRLSQLIDLWYQSHGKTLKDGVYRHSRMLSIADRLGNPLLQDFTASQFSDYRAMRVTEVKPSTVNHELRYMRALFNEMDRLGFYEGINPLGKIRQFREQEREMGFLTKEQIPILLEACADSENKHLTTVVKLCLSTGARFGEAEYLVRTGLISGKQPSVRFSDTKNGRSRSVPISESLHAEIKAVSNPATQRKLFNPCRTAFRCAAERSKIQFPEGQMTHILRHTFASHFMMNGGDLLTLQKVLGHSDLKMTLRYSHLSPEYLEQVLELNPLKNINLSSRLKVSSIFDGLAFKGS
ncbi:phage integrase [Thalassolituus oleivorans]|uniref:phage integrase n=1 Tax=Thalassolituus oleivorans TaxID=187493 RepID=UPI0023F554C7|nr:tyrosine-type recombinase/integrase [Thalassolituus oleivorans]